METCLTGNHPVQEIFFLHCFFIAPASQATGISDGTRVRTAKKMAGNRKWLPFLPVH